MRVAGIMSGTSLDGIDVAIVEIRGRAVETVGFQSTPYPAAVRAAILAVSNTQTTTAAISRLNFQLPELYAKAVQRAVAKFGGVELIGCHGQTVYHEGRKNTLQLGEPAVLVERTGIPVVSNFRARDIAAGGQGAPLVPFVDYLLFRHARRRRIALNIGGIANITVIPAGAAPEDVIAFDTGPGNMVMDALAREYTGGKLNYDRGGKIAASGAVQTKLLDELLRDPYYRRPSPKSAGREQYGAEFVDRLKKSGASPADLMATATVLTAATIAIGIGRADTSTDLIVSGGGVHNPEIMAHLAGFLPEIAISTSTDHGIDADAKEAIAFAVLAHETWRQRPSNLPSATGARGPRVLGSITR
ncbi:MAG TPA: anhydro-N-acetylmuramic acid kinase [Candidatus Sulfopaludibacter sp.]|jgi:anhydro-N-acetylmuramic acid kinase|nr:anhydro-N-acetylmuramic acid kinase [Candidatus Sulfopaludibacter sp.]